MVTLQIRCKCGKVLRVPETLAGRKVACPACKCAYRVSAERFAATKKPVAISPGPPKESASEIELPSIDPASSPSELNLLEGIELAPPGPVCPGCRKPQPLGAKICVSCGIELSTGRSLLEGKQVAPVQLGYADTGRPRRLTGRATGDVIEGPKRGFWSDLFLAFVFPFWSAHNAIGSLVLLCVNAVAPFFCFGAILDCYMSAIYMNVVSDTAAGTDDLNAAPLQDGVYESLFKPGLCFFAAFLLCMVPSVLYGVLVASGVIAPNPVLFILWTSFGILMWPMFVLMASLSQWHLLLRPDLVLVTMARTVLPYLSICSALACAMLLYMATSIGQDILVAMGFQSTNLLKTLLGAMGSAIAGRIIYSYFMIVAMRLIGLYYLHYKKRFAFKLE